MKKQIAIFLCDVTGIMARPWAEAGYTSYCVDLQHPVRNPKKERVGQGEIIFTYGDARYWCPPDNTEIIFAFAFPVCTDMAGSGSQDYSNKRGTPRKGIPQLMDGLMLFNSCYQVCKWSGAPFGIENPVGVIPTHFRKPDYYFQPWEYGDLWTKKTCLWTGNGFVMPEKKFTRMPEGTRQAIWLMSPGEDRANKRSETPAEFAKAVFEANCKSQKLKLAI
jgi:hypothetical protein